MPPAGKMSGKILIEVYTDWCGWCRTMHRNTYNDEKVAAYINAHFYPVRFNAEQRTPVKLGKRVFGFIPGAGPGGRGVHELITTLLGTSEPVYPSAILLDGEFDVIRPVEGYLKAGDFYRILTLTETHAPPRNRK